MALSPSALPVERLAEHLTTLLEQLVADAGRPLGALHPLTMSERERLEGWNQTAVPFPGDRCAHELERRGSILALTGHRWPPLYTHFSILKV